LTAAEREPVSRALDRLTMNAATTPQSRLAAHSRRGHFVFESGHHGDLWIDLDTLLADGEYFAQWAGELADRVRPRAPEVVCGPETGGARLAERIAMKLGIQFVLTERELAAPQSAVCYRLPADMRAAVKGRRVVLVDDAINAGSAVGASLAELASNGANVVAIGCLLALNSQAEALADSHGLPLIRLLQCEHTLWRPEDCPVCRNH
jgi:orotate phosphoribosyltransferase